jgi:hypothetical protein
MWVLGGACLLIGFLPIALTPLQADDAFLMLQYNGDSHGVVGVVSDAIDTTLAQDRTNFGTAVASGLHSYLLWNGALALGVGPQVVDVVLGFLWVLAATAAAARFASRAWPLGRTGYGMGAAFFVIAACAAATAQIHSRWSQDPMVSYPMYGLGTAAVGLLYLDACLESSTRNRIGPRSLVALLVVGLLAAFWYEMLWPLFLLATFMAGRAWTVGRGRSTGAARTPVLFWSSAVAVPVLVLVLTRVLSGGPGQYEGTQFTFGGTAIKSGVLGLLSTVPAAAWPLSARVTPFNLREQPLISAFLLAGLVYFGVAITRHLARSADEIPPSAKASPVSPWLPVGMIVYFWLSCVGSVTFSAKYATEVRELGATYHYYAPGLFSFAILVYAAVALASRSDRAWRLVAVAVAVTPVLVTAQLAVNWSLLSVQEKDLSSLSRLLEIGAGEQTAIRQRCEAAAKFEAADIPGYGYPAEEMLASLDELYARRTGQSFCP